MSEKLQELEKPFFLKATERLGVKESNGEFPYRILAEIRRVRYASNNFTQIQGNKFLDLGGGSSGNIDTVHDYLIQNLKIRKLLGFKEDDRFHPWYSRVVNALGGDAHCFDIGDNSNESFASTKGDIIDPNSLSGFESNTFDSINNYKFTVQPGSKHHCSGNSPALLTALGISNRNCGSKLANGDYSNIDYSKLDLLDSDVTGQVLRILKNGGIYTHNEEILKKEGTRLTRVGKMEGLGS